MRNQGHRGVRREWRRRAIHIAGRFEAPPPLSHWSRAKAFPKQPPCVPPPSSPKCFPLAKTTLTSLSPQTTTRREKNTLQSLQWLPPATRTCPFFPAPVRGNERPRHSHLWSRRNIVRTAVRCAILPDEQYRAWRNVRRFTQRLFGGAPASICTHLCIYVHLRPRCERSLPGRRFDKFYLYAAIFARQSCVVFELFSFVFVF